MCHISGNLCRNEYELELMKKTLVPWLLLQFCTACSMTAKSEQDVITKTFPVKPGGQLIMNVDRGSIHITTSDSDKVDVAITRGLTGVSSAEAKKIFEQHKIKLSSSESGVKIEAEKPQKIGLFRNPFSRLQVDYAIVVPARFDIDVRTAGGHIEVGDLDGKAAVHTSGGNLKLGAIKGPLKAHTAGGHITLTRSEGDAEVSTSGGNLELGEIQGSLVAHTSGGHITLQKTRGSVNASTSGGNIRVQDAYGPITARTSGGNVSAQLNTQPTSDCSLKTSGGNIEVLLASNLALELDAHTSGGKVDSDFPGSLNKQQTRLTARINGGGPDLVLETSGGNVNIRKK